MVLKFNQIIITMTESIITKYLKDKGFIVTDSGRINVIAAYNITSQLIVSWVMTDMFKGKHVVVIAHQDTRDVRFNGKITNLQQFNMIINAVE